MENVNSVWDIIGMIVGCFLFSFFIIGVRLLLVKLMIEIEVDHTKSEAEQDKEREKYFEQSLNQFSNSEYPYN